MNHIYEDNMSLYVILHLKIYFLFIVEICADWESGEVMVKQLGSNNSAVDDRELFKGEITRLPITATLYILANEYPHIVKVRKHYSNSPKSVQAKDKSEKKRHLIAEEEEKKPVKKMKTEHKEKLKKLGQNSEEEALSSSLSSLKNSESHSKNGKLKVKQEKISHMLVSPKEEKIEDQEEVNKSRSFIFACLFSLIWFLHHSKNLKIELLNQV